VTDGARRGLAIALVVLLTILHHDAWLWDDATLVADFLPVGLAYHAAFSLVASLVWLVVVYLVWPSSDDTEWEAEG
jgi:hypothetical protein